MPADTLSLPSLPCRSGRLHLSKRRSDTNTTVVGVVSWVSGWIECLLRPCDLCFKSKEARLVLPHASHRPMPVATIRQSLKNCLSCMHPSSNYNLTPFTTESHTFVYWYIGRKWQSRFPTLDEPDDIASIVDRTARVSKHIALSSIFLITSTQQLKELLTRSDSYHLPSTILLPPSWHVSQKWQQ